jgi:hypothetical protein
MLDKISFSGFEGESSFRRSSGWTLSLISLTVRTDFSASRQQNHFVI